MEKVVIDQCTSCGSQKEIKGGEIPKGEQPMCDKCFSPMIAIRMEFREDFLEL